jgi:hypothetical protein
MCVRIGYFGPAIVSPETNGFTDLAPSRDARRVLVLISKALQVCAWGVCAYVLVRARVS